MADGSTRPFRTYALGTKFTAIIYLTQPKLGDAR
jgi:hypothetical protein